MSEAGESGVMHAGRERPGRHRAAARPRSITVGRATPSAGTPGSGAFSGGAASRGTGAFGAGATGGRTASSGAASGATASGATADVGAFDHGAFDHGAASRGSAGVRAAAVGVDGGGTARSGTAGGVTMTAARPGGPGAGLFTQAVLDYAAHRPGQPLTLLQAGCTTAGDDPDVGLLRAAGCVLGVSLIDDDSLTAREAALARPDLAACTRGDLRTTPLAPRSFDIVHCALLLERISHAELVLDRFVEALKPGGLLLLSTGDRDCAAGFLERVLPRSLRARIWRSLRPGEPGPYPAVYDDLVSGHGVHAYALRRGLVIGPREVLNLLAGRRRPRGLWLTSKVVARLSWGRLTAAHDQLRYVIRKPESTFARVL
jgi:SAM-dependent methyltransferase